MKIPGTFAGFVTLTNRNINNKQKELSDEKEK
jgi:hypothetical protein